jgi:predicted small secreted protein
MTSHNFFSSRHLRAAIVATVAAMALVLSGCNTGGGPGVTDTASPAVSQAPSATPTPTPTATPAYVPASASGRAQNVPVPVLPEVAKTETKEGLEAFARYWFELLSYGYETGDTAQISAITSTDCTMCERAKEVQQGWHSNGRWLEGGRVFTPAVATSFLVAADGNYQVAVQVSQEALSYHNVDGSVDSTDPKTADSGSLMLVVFKNGSWFVNTIEPIVG